MSIKKVTLNYGYGCWKRTPTDLNSDHASFTFKLVKYIRRPEISCKTNPRIEYSYCPSNNQFSMNRENISYFYEEDFMKLCSAAESLIGKTQYERICDAIPSSLEILYDDGRKIEIPLGMKVRDPAIDFIYEIANRYAPDFFKNKKEEEE